MTATPDRELLQKADRGEMALVRISARYHGRPLPEPEIVRVTLPLPEDYTRFQGKAEHSSGRTGKTIRSRFRRPDRVLTIIRRSLKAGRKLFVFVPTVALSDLVCKGLSNSLQIPRIASIHSSHPNRDLHREAFSKGEIDIIVSTSVLERGITVPNADVLILYADYEQVFDTATLIQMAGRAGRTEDDTEARVYFAAEHITPSMRTAVQLTHDMNRHAAASGYLQS
jgi:competence protein ComFA